MSVLVVGSANTDILVRVRRAPLPGETVLGGDAEVQAGGKGANQAVAAARAGAATAFCGAVGGDTFASVPREALRSAGVDLQHLRELTVPSGIALITISDDGENSITVASGANARLSPEDLPADFSNFNHLLMQQEIPPQTVLAAAQKAKQSGVQVLLNAAPSHEFSNNLWPLLDYLIVNEHELAQLAGTAEGQEESAARSLLERGVGAVIVTLGGRGSLAITPAGLFRQAAHKVVVVDTTGAGDTFCGVLAAWLCGGSDLPEALKAAGVAGALACTKLGAQAAMPTRSEIEGALAG
ncbi:ribokinase [Deinococcus psychrotolerans]|uniref:Ribokinase n=1 Tax=Deinococcus psychrotolerans TaxID=2489213 RepID=A0A3G8YD06_9DEIO|nr:ribokinase [Deinococcus psychrotolerans]AZI43279.1 ribokinase [Deinococcus psychrotolerans]